MPWPGFKLGGFFSVAKPLNELRTPGMEPAPGRRMQQVGGLSRRDILEDGGIRRVGVRNSGN
jgi:hypothetical protein